MKLIKLVSLALALGILTSPQLSANAGPPDEPSFVEIFTALIGHSGDNFEKLIGEQIEDNNGTVIFSAREGLPGAQINNIVHLTENKLWLYISEYDFSKTENIQATTEAINKAVSIANMFNKSDDYVGSDVTEGANSKTIIKTKDGETLFMLLTNSETAKFSVYFFGAVSN